MMTFKQDILPIIEALCSEGYHVTVIGKKYIRKILITLIMHILYLPEINIL